MTNIIYTYYTARWELETELIRNHHEKDNSNFIICALALGAVHKKILSKDWAKVGGKWIIKDFCLKVFWLRQMFMIWIHLSIFDAAES